MLWRMGFLTKLHEAEIINKTLVKLPLNNRIYMNNKKITFALVLALLFAGTAFSQQKIYDEHVFVYKVVQGDEIKANIFCPQNGAQASRIYILPRRRIYIRQPG